MPAEFIDLSELKALISDLRRLDSTAGRRIVHAMKLAAQFVADDAQHRASWSTRIPGSIKVSATQRALVLKAGGRRAPHADVYEFGGRHPLFGNREHWYPVEARSYMEDARDANIDRLSVALLDAVVTAIETRGG